MLDTFFLSFHLRSAYRVNRILYSLKSIPLVKKLLPDALYGNTRLNVFAQILSLLTELGTMFLGKAVYMALLILLPLRFMKGGEVDAFLHIFFFLTLAGGLLNTQIFNPTKDKYYGMFVMRMDARKYTLSNYVYFLLRMWVGFLPFSLLFGLLTGQSIISCLLMPFLVCGVKIIITKVTLYKSQNGQHVRSENLPPVVIWVGAVVLTIFAYLPPFFGYAISAPIFIALCVGTILIACVSFPYVWRFAYYRRIYRTLLTQNDFVMEKVDVRKITQDNYKKKIEADLTQTSSQKGYRYLNEIFMKRHAKVLTRTAKRITLALIAVFIIWAIACLIVPEIKTETNGLLLVYLPYMLFVMYLMNRGRTITGIMFSNCDSSMLAYRSYRKPKAILQLFAARIQSIAAINLMPAAVIALGLPAMLYISGGTDQIINYVIIFVSIIAMSVFFSVHTLVLYYLLQPYNAQMETRNGLYEVINWVTYMVCYLAMGKKVSTLMFGLGVSAFCILYVAVALVLAYRLAPRTFRIRQ